VVERLSAGRLDLQLSRARLPCGGSLRRGIPGVSAHERGATMGAEGFVSGLTAS
jgi:hypothetical protein